jgi:hypothetical protein
MRLTAALAAILCAVGFAACGSSNSTPTTPSAPATSTEILTASVDPGNSHVVTFTVTVAGTTTVTLLAIATGTGPLFAPAVTAPVNVGVGNSNDSGATCSVVAQAALTSQLTPQLTGSLASGTGCVVVTDLGNLTGTATFTLRVDHT